MNQPPRFTPDSKSNTPHLDADYSTLDSETAGPTENCEWERICWEIERETLDKLFAIQQSDATS
jgi:hypothetical protein